MRVIISGDTEIQVEGSGGAELKIESEAPGLHLSPLHMLAASLATCTLSVLMSWALQSGHDFDDLKIGLAWEYADDPYRVGSYEMVIRWPSLSTDRHEAALRVAQHCTVEQTLRVSPEIRVLVSE